MGFVSKYACAAVFLFSMGSGAGTTIDVGNLAQWQSAIATAKQGDTIRLLPSVNGLELTLGWVSPPNLPSTGTCESKPEYCLTITGMPGKQTIFTSGSLVISRSNVVVRNLKFRQNRLDAVPLKVENAKEKLLSNVRLTDLVFEDLGPAAMDTARVRYALYVGALAVGGVDYPVTDVRVDSSYFNRIDYAIVMRINSFVRGVRIDHNYFSDAASCPANGCDAIHLGGNPYGDVEPWMDARVDHNKFIRMKGESELISSKVWGSRIENNLIIEPRGAISFRAGKGSIARHNVIVKPATNPLRPVGLNHVIEGNVVVLSPNVAPLILFYGTDRLYPGHMDGKTCVENPVGKETGGYDPVGALVIRGNWFASKTPLPVYVVRKDIVCGCDPKTQTPINCPVAPNVRVESGNRNVAGSFDSADVLGLVNSSDDFCAVFRADPKKPSAWNGSFSIIDCDALETVSVGGRTQTEEYVNLGKKYRMFPN